MRLADYAPRSALVSSVTDVRSASVPAIDVHNHLGRWLTDGRRWMAPDLPALLGELDALGVAAVVNLDGRWDEELEANLDRYDRAHPGRFATFCQLDWSRLTTDGGPEALIRQLERAAAAGAAGVKVWKDLGLSVRDGTGQLVQVDDLRLSDIWDTAGRLGLPVLVHTADPVAFWAPLDRHNERFEELAIHPEWHHGGRDVPGHGALITALERLLAAHRSTTFIGAHLASCAEDLPRVDRILAAHPNLVVDVSAREAELGRQPRAARAFILEHQDRVLWGTDAFPFEAARYRTWFRVLESADEYFPYSTAEVPPQGRWAVSGLALPPQALAAVYAGNARRVIPALAR
jgi:predicted TIM-barrel fold metal-dependent hydrolase